MLSANLDWRFIAKSWIPPCQRYDRRGFQSSDEGERRAAHFSWKMSDSLSRSPSGRGAPERAVTPEEVRERRRNPTGYFYYRDRYSITPYTLSGLRWCRRKRRCLPRTPRIPSKEGIATSSGSRSIRLGSGGAPLTSSGVNGLSVRLLPLGDRDKESLISHEEVRRTPLTFVRTLEGPPVVALHGRVQRFRDKSPSKLAITSMSGL